MPTSLLTVPNLLDRFSLSSSSQSSSSYSFFGNNVDGSSDSYTELEPEPEPQSPNLSKRDIKTQVISPQDQATPKPSYSLVRRVMESDCGYESDREENTEAIAPRRKKAQKRRIKQQQIFEQVSEETLIGLGLNFKCPPSSKLSRITRPSLLPEQPILRATTLPNSPSPVIPLPSPLVPSTKSLNPIRPVDSTSSVSPLLITSPLLVSTIFRMHASSSPLTFSRC